VALEKTGIQAVLAVDDQGFISTFGRAETKVASFQKKVSKTGFLQAFAKSSVRLGEGIRTLGTAISSTGRSLIGLGGAMAPFTAGLGLAIRDTVRFQDQMSILRSVTGETGSALAALERKSLEIGRKTLFGAREAAEGLTELKRAGLSVEQTLDAGLPVSQFAQAMNIGMGESARTASLLITALDQKAETLSISLSKMAKAANSSATNASEMSAALSFAGPVANKLGVHIDELFASVGAMANAGVRAGKAGRNLREFFGRILRPSKTARKELGDFSRTIFDTTTGNIKPMMEVVQDLTTRLNRIKDPIKRNQVALEAFGTRGQVVFANLQKSMLDPSQKGFAGLTKQIKEAEEELQRLMDLRVDNVVSQLKLLRSNVESLNIMFLTHSMQLLKEPLKDINEFLGGVTDTMVALSNPTVRSEQEFAKLVEAMDKASPTAKAVGRGLSILGKIVSTFVEESVSKIEKLAKTLEDRFGENAIEKFTIFAGAIALVAAIAAPAVVAFGVFVAALGQVTSTIGSIVSAFKLFAPLLNLFKFGPQTIAIIALVGLFSLLVSSVEDGVNPIKGAFSKISSFVDGFLANFEPAFGFLKEIFVETGAVLFESLGNLFSAVFLPILKAFGLLGNSAEETGGKFGVAFTKIIDVVGILIASVGQAVAHIINFLSPIVGYIVELIIPQIASTINFFRLLVTGVAKIFKGDFLGALIDISLAIKTRLLSPFQMFIKLILDGMDALGFGVSKKAREFLLAEDIGVNITPKPAEHKADVKAKEKKDERSFLQRILEEFGLQEGTFQLNQTIHNNIDGKKVGSVISRNQKELKDRAGFSAENWQTQFVADFGSISTKASGSR